MTAVIIIAAVILFFALLLNISITAYIRYVGGEIDVKVKYMFFRLFSYNGEDSDDDETDREKKTDEPPPEKEKYKSEIADFFDDDIAAADDEDGEDEAAVRKKKEPSENPHTEEEKAGKDNTASPKRRKMRRVKPVKDKKNFIEGLEEKKELITLIWELCGKPLKKLFGGISITGITIDLAAADKDAAKCALLYGKMAAAASNAVAWLSTLFRVKVKSAKLNALFDHPSEETRYDFTAKVKIRPSTILGAALTVIISYLLNTDKYSVVMDAMSKGKDK